MLHKPEISGYVRPLNQRHAKRCYQLFNCYCQSVSFWINNAEPLHTSNPSLGRIPHKLYKYTFIYLFNSGRRSIKLFFSAATSGSHIRKSCLPEKDPEWHMWVRKNKAKSETEKSRKRTREKLIKRKWLRQQSLIQFGAHYSGIP